jgi:hypothetical protein
VKYDKDVRKALDAIPRLVDPNADVPESIGNGHGHEHGHGHEDEPAVDGPAVRAAKDRPGRFTDGYYGTPTTSSLARRRVL